MTIDQQTADRWLTEDVKWAEDTVKNLVQVKLTQGQFDALVDFVYNLGIKQFEGSTLLKMLNDGLMKESRVQLSRWVYDDGKIENGLVTRRARAVLLFGGESF